MCTGAEIPAALAASAAAGETAAAVAPEAAAAGVGAAGLGTDSLGLLGGAANELGATSSSIGAAGGAANPLSIGLGNAQSLLSPYLAQGGNALRAYQGANSAMGLMGMGQKPAAGGGAAPARPMGQPAPLYSSSQILGNRGVPGGPISNASMIGGGMGMGGGGMNPQLMQLLMRLKGGM